MYIIKNINKFNIFNYIHTYITISIRLICIVIIILFCVLSGIHMCVFFPFSNEIRPRARSWKKRRCKRSPNASFANNRCKAPSPAMQPDSICRNGLIPPSCNSSAEEPACHAVPGNLYEWFLVRADPKKRDLIPSPLADANAHRRLNSSRSRSRKGNLDRYQRQKVGNRRFERLRDQKLAEYWRVRRHRRLRVNLI